LCSLKQISNRVYQAAQVNAAFPSRKAALREIWKGIAMESAFKKMHQTPIRLALASRTGSGKTLVPFSQNT
jgi:hypothetical protein